MADTFADLLREVGIADDTRSQTMQAAQRPMRRPRPRVLMNPQGPIRRQGGVNEQEAHRIENPEGLTYGEEAILGTLEPTGLPSFRRGGRALAQGRGGDAAGEFALGGLGLLTMGVGPRVAARPPVAGRGLFGAGPTRGVANDPGLFRSTTIPPAVDDPLSALERGPFGVRKAPSWAPDEWAWTRNARGELERPANPLTGEPETLTGYERALMDQEPPAPSPNPRQPFPKPELWVNNEPPPAPIRPPPRQIGAGGLPVRPREPFRNSMRGGSEDLREAARPRAQQPRPDGGAAQGVTVRVSADHPNNRTNMSIGLPPMPLSSAGEATGAYLQNTKLARMADAEILGPGALDQRVARALAVNPDLTDAQITTMLYGANRKREAAIAASRQRVAGGRSSPRAAPREPYRRTPQQPLPPVPAAYGPHLTQMEQRVAQALEVNPSLSDSQINTMLFGASAARPEDKLIGIIRRNLERKKATRPPSEPLASSVGGVPVPGVVQRDLRRVARIATDGAGAAPRALPRQYAGVGGRMVAMGDVGKLPFHEGPGFLGQLPRRPQGAPVDPKAVWAGAGVAAFPTGAATASLVTQNAEEQAAIERMQRLNAQSRAKLEAYQRGPQVYQNPGRPAWENRQIYTMPGDLEQPNEGYAINPATGRPLPAPKYYRRKNAPAYRGPGR